MVWYHDAAGCHLKSESRGRELELLDMAYDDGDRQPRWLDVMEGLKERGVRCDGAALASLPLELEFDDAVIARYGS